MGVNHHGPLDTVKIKILFRKTLTACRKIQESNLGRGKDTKLMFKGNVESAVNKI